MTINGYNIDIDFTDADVIQKIEEGKSILYNGSEELKGTTKDKNFNIAEGIRQECKIIKDFFDYVLGDGTSEKIFKGKDSLNLCLQAYEDIINTYDKQYEELNKKIDTYSPDRLAR